MLVATAFASLVEQRGGREEGGRAGGAESDMEMICHSGAEIISPRSGKSVRNQIQRFVSQMTQPPNYFISHQMWTKMHKKIGKAESSNIYENAQSSRSEIMKICNKKNTTKMIGFNWVLLFLADIAEAPVLK